jgi:hypothetical protein
MKPHKIRRAGMALVLAGLAFASLPLPACTIIVLTDTNRALFCNNEDWSNPKTRIWFLPPATASRYVKVGPNQVLIVSGRKVQLPDG